MAITRVSPVGRLLVILLGVILLGTIQCAPKREQISLEDLRQRRDEFLITVEEDAQFVADTLHRRMQFEQREFEEGSRDRPPVMDILVLSGGGSGGAFGAGFLKGWGMVEEDPLARPQFDIVTGISTGALMAVHRVTSIAIASASIPGAFPAVMLDGGLYVDGGATMQHFLGTDSDWFDAALGEWQLLFPGEALPRTRIWVILNSSLLREPRLTKRSQLGTAKSAVRTMISQSSLASLQIYELRVALLRESRGAEIEFRYVTVPSDFVPGDGRAETMAALAELGLKMGSDPSTWRSRVPNPEWPSDFLEHRQQAVEGR